MLLAYSKMWLYDELLASTLPDDPWIATALERYFPQPLRETLRAAYMPRHPLQARDHRHARRSTAWSTASARTFVHRLCETTGAQPREIVRAYLLAREVFGCVPLWQPIEALDNKVRRRRAGARC